MCKIGRNDPCPCGSGQKFKKCCIDKGIPNTKNKFDLMIFKVAKFMLENNDVEACNVWFKVWDSLKQKITPEIKSIEELDEKYSGQESIFNWCQDLEMTLGNVGQDNPEFHEKRIEFCHEFVELLPESNKLVIENMRRAEAESLFAIGKWEEGEKAFALLAKDFPESAWVYIGWGDMYCLFRNNEKIPLDYEKAEKLYREALTKELNESDKKSVLERLADLEDQKKA